MTEKSNAVTFQGNPLTLVGNELKVGDLAPNVNLTDNDMNNVNLSSYRGKILVLVSVPSLDTPVCDAEVRRFNKEASELGPDVNIVTVSMDLPFAQKRWCAASGIDRVTTLSDYKDREFGKEYGVYIKELGLLARKVFILDQESAIRYTQLVKEVTSEPNYEEVLNEIKKLT